MTMTKVNQKKRGGSGCVNFLPDDLKLEVLSKLPVKSLLRFRCVSKQFLYLISSQSLRKLHHYHSHRTPKQHLLRLFNPRTRTVTTIYVSDLVQEKLLGKFDLPQPVNSSLRSHHCSCHGLMLFSDYMAKDIYVCNPSTHELIKLPETPRASNRSDMDISIAMGFLHESNTYKILVSFLNINNGNNHEFEVCTLKDGGFASWNSVKGHPNLAEHHLSYLHDFVSIDGVVYWMGRLWFEERKQVGSMLLLAFDFRTQDFTVIHGPTYCDFDSSTRLAELKGRLCVVESWKENGRRITIIRVQRCQNNEWERKLEIDEILPYHVLACVPASQENHLRRHVDGQDEEDYDIVYTDYDYSDLRYYNIKNKSLTRMSKPCWFSYDQGNWSKKVFVCDDTLFSLNPLADLQDD